MLQLTNDFIEGDGIINIEMFLPAFIAHLFKRVTVYYTYIDSQDSNIVYSDLTLTLGENTLHLVATCIARTKSLHNFGTILYRKKNHIKSQMVFIT